MRRFQLFLASLALMCFSVTQEARAERAASIDYDFVERPPNIPSEFGVTADCSLRFLAIKAIDGFRIDAALWQPGNKMPGVTTLLIGIHGSGDNFSKPPIGFLSPALAIKGYGVLAINTRQHDN